MNAGQRLLAVLEGQIPDRVPVFAWIDPGFLTNYESLQIMAEVGTRYGRYDLRLNGRRPEEP